jgi:hypothetical protein
VPGPLDRPAQQHAPERPDATDTPGRLRPTGHRADLPAAADRSDAADRLALTEEPARWSKADLRQRLERLPPGHPSSVRGDEPGVTEPPHPRQADEAKRNYWNEVPRFLRAWADHVSRWPAERAAAQVDRSADPAGSWRGDGNQYLDPDQHAQAKDVIAGVARTEKKLTEHMTEAGRDNACGGWLEGLGHRLKGEERLKEKIAERLEHEPDRTPAEVARRIGDAIRYTFCFGPTEYTAGCRDVSRRLEERQYQMVYSKNHWRDDPEYKGINTRWVTPDGQRFEVQFHTSESYHAKEEVTHRSYERLRSPRTPDDERQELRAYQQDVSRWITVPADAAAITDRLPGRAQLDD